jgi:hypothetical protein
MSRRTPLGAVPLVGPPAGLRSGQPGELARFVIHRPRHAEARNLRRPDRGYSR